MEFDGTAVFQWIQDIFQVNDATLQQIADFFRPDNAAFQLGADLARVVLPFAALLILAGLPVLCIAGDVLATTRKRSFYDKGARQLTGLAMGLAWVLVAAEGGMLYMRLGMPATFVLPPPGDLLYWISLVAYALCATLYAALWRPLRTLPALRRLWGALTAASGFWALYVALIIMENDALAAQGLPRVQALPDMLLPTGVSGIWNALAYIFPLALSLAGGTGALWLIARRHRDDYGRDHYNTMVPWCARWARNAWIVIWLILLGFSARQLYTIRQTLGQLPPQAGVEAATRLLLWILPALLWTPTLRSAVPLRHKLALVLALLLGMGFLVPVYTAMPGITV